MAGFRKAKAEQAFLKIALYGLQGTGKTFTALLCAEGLAKVTKKRIAFVDTEHGTDFYASTVKDRKIHPAGFDFDACYSRSLAEVSAAVRELDPATHGIIVLDSITHVWEAAKASYTGKLTKVGTIPFHGWGQIKKPYKELVNFLMNCPFHVFLCGRQGNVFEEDEETGESKAVGTKMKSEGETPYEPHLLIHLEQQRIPGKDSIITAYAEKDRTGLIAGRTIALSVGQQTDPAYTFNQLVKPILPLLGATQAQIPTEAEVASGDAEALSEAEKKRIDASTGVLAKFKARLDLCESSEALKLIAAEITPALKKTMVAADIAELRQHYLETEAKLGRK